MINNVILKMEEYWAIRVIEEKNDTKRVIKEIFFDIEPTKEDIALVLLEYDVNCFVSVAHNYRMMRKDRATK